MKKEIKYWSERVVAIFVCVIAYNVLDHFHVRPWYPSKDIGLFSMLLTWTITFYGGDYLIRKHDGYLLKRRIKKLAKQLAKFYGLNEKELDMKSAHLEYDKETGIMEVVIEHKKEQEEEE